jgi:hypothetical protein
MYEAGGTALALALGLALSSLLALGLALALLVAERSFAYMCLQVLARA